jgi:hypothetical protein
MNALILCHILQKVTDKDMDVICRSSKTVQIDPPQFVFMALILECPQFPFCVLTRTCNNFQCIPIMSKAVPCHAVSLLVFDTNINKFFDVLNQTSDLDIRKADISHGKKR